MSLFDELTKKTAPQKKPAHPFSDFGEPNDVYDEIMANSQPSTTIYPYIDTAGKAPINNEPQGVIDFVLDNLAAGGGRSLESWGQIIEDGMRPEGMTPSEWKEKQSSLFKTVVGGMQSTGREIYERNARQYKPQSLEYYLANVLQSAPESVALMLAGLAAGGPVGGLLGATARGVGGMAMESAAARNLAWQMAKAAQSNSVSGKALRAVIPAGATAAGANLTSHGLEALSESNSTKQEYIEDAKRNGTYTPDVTEQEAEAKAKDAFWGNYAWLALTGTPQWNMFLGKPAKGVGGKVTRGLLGAGAEGVQEGGQEIINALSLDKDIDPQRVLDAAITGGIMGAGFQGAGYVSDRVRGVPTADEIEEAKRLYNEQRKQYSDRIAGVNVNENGTAEYDSNSRYGRYRDDYFGKPSEAAARSAYSQASGANGIDNFMRAISGQESGSEEGDYSVVNSRTNATGRFQIMPENWSRWAQDAGLSANAPMTPENQDRVARNKMQEYYAKFGNWRDVAIAWYAGEGEVTNPSFDHNAPQGNGDEPSVNEYADSVMSRFQNLGGGQASRQPRGGNIFGVENYDMPTQSSSIDSQVSQLKSGWEQVIPQIGGALKNRFGINAEISSAARSAEHNAEVGGVPTSYHIIREEGGDALDIVFDRDTTQEEQDRIADYFRSTGLFSEVLYHDVGSGAHLHLGGLKTENLNSFQSRAGRAFSENYNPNDPTRPSWQEYNEQLDRGEDQSKAKPPKPLFDFTNQDSTTKRLLQQFATKKLTESTAVENHGVFNFFDSMFNEKGEFQDTPENRKAIAKNYRDDFIEWATPFLRAQEQQAAKPEQKAKPAQAPTSKQEIKQQGNKFLNNTGLTEALNQLKKKARNENNIALALKINDAKDDVEALKQLLKENGIDINQTAPQEQENHVQNNTAPENVLTSPQGTAQDTGREKLIKLASAPVDIRKGKQTQKRRQNQAWAMLNLANEYGIKLPNGVFTAIQKGSAREMKELQMILEHEGTFKSTPPIPAAQTPPAAPNPLSQQTNATPVTDTIFQAQVQQARKQAYQAAGKNWNNIKNRYSERGSVLAPLEREADLANEENQSPKSPAPPVPPTPPTGAPQTTPTTPPTTTPPKTSEIGTEDELLELRSKIDTNFQLNSHPYLKNYFDELFANARSVMGDPKKTKDSDWERIRAAANMEPLTDTELKAFDEDFKADEEKERRKQEAQENDLRQRNKQTATVITKILDRDPNDIATNLDLDFALADQQGDKNALKRQGAILLGLLDRPELRYTGDTVKNIGGLKKALENGSQKAVRQAQDMLHEIAESYQQNNQQKQQEHRPLKTPEEIAQEQRQRNQKKAQREATKAERKEREELPAVDQAQQAQETYQKKQQQRQQEQSQQALDTAQQGFLQSTANAIQARQQREAQNEKDAFDDEVQFEDELFDTEVERHEAWEDIFSEDSLLNIPPSESKKERVAQGRAILGLIDSPEFKSEYGAAPIDPVLRRAVRDGTVKGIAEIQKRAKELIAQKNTEGSAPKNPEPESPDFTPTEPEPKSNGRKAHPLKGRKGRKKTAKDRLYEKFKADTHPHLKAHLDDLIQKASSDKDSQERREAIDRLRGYQQAQDISDESLDVLERADAREKEAQERANRAAQSRARQADKQTKQRREELLEEEEGDIENQNTKQSQQWVEEEEEENTEWAQQDKANRENERAEQAHQQQKAALRGIVGKARNQSGTATPSSDRSQRSRQAKDYFDRRKQYEREADLTNEETDDERPAFDYLPETDELNDVETPEENPQPESSPKAPPQPESPPAKVTITAKPAKNGNVTLYANGKRISLKDLTDSLTANPTEYKLVGKLGTFTFKEQVERKGSLHNEVQGVKVIFANENGDSVETSRTPGNPEYVPFREAIKFICDIPYGVAKFIPAEVKAETKEDSPPVIVDESLLQELHEKLPVIKEAVDYLFEIASRPFKNKKVQDKVTQKAQNKLNQLSNGNDLTEEEQLEQAARDINEVWRAARNANGNITDKDITNRKTIDNLLDSFEQGNISAQDLYRQVGQIVSSKHFSKKAKTKPSKTAPPKDSETKPDEVPTETPEPVQTKPPEPESQEPQPEGVWRKFGEKIFDSPEEALNYLKKNKFFQKKYQFKDLAIDKEGAFVNTETHKQIPFRVKETGGKFEIQKLETPEPKPEPKPEPEPEPKLKWQSENGYFDKASIKKDVGGSKNADQINLNSDGTITNKEGEKYPYLWRKDDDVYEYGWYYHEDGTPATESEVAELIAKQEAEKTKPKERQDAGTWKSIAQAYHQEDLLEPLQKHFSNPNLFITPDNLVIDTTTDQPLNNIKIIERSDGAWEAEEFSVNKQKSRRSKQIKKEKELAKTEDDKRIIEATKDPDVANAHDKAIDILNKYNRHGDSDTTISNFVKPEDLTPQQKLLVSFGEKLGVKTKFFRNEDGDFHGSHDRNVTFINTNSNMPIDKVFWHETLHWLRNNNPELYKALVKAAGITTAQREAYLKETERTDIRTPDEINEEIIADMMMDTAKRTGLLQSIASKNRGLIERIVQWLKDTMNKFIDHFRNPSGKLTTKQAQELAKTFGRIAAHLKDPNGQTIFRYNRRTGNIELADGRDLSENALTRATTKSIGAGFKPKYSFAGGNDSNSNSNQSLRQRITNKVSSWFDNSPRSKKRNELITDNLSKIMGMRTTFGYVKGADQTIIDDFNKIIREPHAYRWETFLPKIGGKVAQSLKLDPTPEMGNYIADWMLTGALNNNSSEAADFQQAMRDNPAQAELMQEIRAAFQEASDLHGLDRINDTLRSTTEKPPLTERAKGYWRDSREQLVDDLRPIERLIEDMAKKLPADVAEELKKSFDPYKAFRTLRGLGAIPDMMIKTADKHIEEVRTALREHYPNLNFDNFKTLNMIFNDVGGDVRGLNSYAVAMLDKEIHEKNRAKGLQEGDPGYIEPSFSEAEDDLAIKQGKAKFGQAQKDLVNFANTLLAIKYDAGLISQKQFFAIMNGWQNYVPMARVFEENEDFHFEDSLKRRKGSKRDTWLPTDKLIANAHEFIRQAEQNKVKLQLVDLVRCGGVGEVIAESEVSGGRRDTTITFREGGKLKYLETPDVSIKRAIDSMYRQSDGNWFTKMIRAAGAFMRAMFTFGNIDFIAGNFFRDLPDAFIHNKHLSKNPFVALMEMWRAGFSSVLKKDQNFYDWLAHGGSQSSFVSEDVDYVQRSINASRPGARKERYSSRHFFSQLLDDIQLAAEYSEYLTRLNTYNSALNKRKAQNGGKITSRDKDFAALESREASIDFAKSGTSTRALNRYVLFANAAVQGIDLWGRTIQRAVKGDKGAQKELFGKVFRTLTAGVLCSILQSFINGTDDDWRKKYERRPDWEKANYWLLGNGLRIPKGMDIGIRLSSALTDMFLSEQPAEAKRVGEIILGALPSITSTVFTPLVEVRANHSFFRDAPIVPVSQQTLPAEMQYGKNTSGFAKLVGEKLGFSPRNVDHLIQGYLGFMGRYLSSLDLDQYTDPYKMPITHRFLFDPDTNPKSVQEYYKAYEEQDGLWRGYRLKRQEGKKVDLPEDFDRKLYARLKSIREQLSAISKRERRIIDDPDLDSDKRKEQLRELEQRRAELCEKALNKAR